MASSLGKESMDRNTLIQQNAQVSESLDQLIKQMSVYFGLPSFECVEDLSFFMSTYDQLCINNMSHLDLANIDKSKLLQSLQQVYYSYNNQNECINFFDPITTKWDSSSPPLPIQQTLQGYWFDETSRKTESKPLFKHTITQVNTILTNLEPSVETKNRLFDVFSKAVHESPEIWPFFTEAFYTYIEDLINDKTRYNHLSEQAKQYMKDEWFHKSQDTSLKRPAEPEDELPNKVRCRALTQHKLRCSHLTKSPLQLCPSHINSTSLNWNVSPESQPLEDITTEKKVLLKKNKQGIIIWPNTNYVVKSKEELFVCRKLNADWTKFKLLEAKDILYCKEHGIPCQPDTDLDICRDIKEWFKRNILPTFDPCPDQDCTLEELQELDVDLYKTIVERSQELDNQRSFAYKEESYHTHWKPTAVAIKITQFLKMAPVSQVDKNMFMDSDLYKRFDVVMPKNEQHHIRIGMVRCRNLLLPLYLLEVCQHLKYVVHVDNYETDSYRHFDVSIHNRSDKQDPLVKEAYKRQKHEHTEFVKSMQRFYQAFCTNLTSTEFQLVEKPSMTKTDHMSLLCEISEEPQTACKSVFIEYNQKDPKKSALYQLLILDCLRYERKLCKAERNVQSYKQCVNEILKELKDYWDIFLQLNGMMWFINYHHQKVFKPVMEMFLSSLQETQSMEVRLEHIDLVLTKIALSS